MVFGKNAWAELSHDDNYKCNFDNVTLDLLESVWITYGHHTGNSIAALTHTELPWLNARMGLVGDEPSTTRIKPDDMQRFYQSIYTGGEA